MVIRAAFVCILPTVQMNMIYTGLVHTSHKRVSQFKACSSCYHTKVNDNQIEANASGRKFDILDKRDVMVFLHIQKTGATTFNRNPIRVIG